MQRISRGGKYVQVRYNARVRYYNEIHSFLIFFFLDLIGKVCPKLDLTADDTLFLIGKAFQHARK